MNRSSMSLLLREPNTPSFAPKRNEQVDPEEEINSPLLDGGANVQVHSAQTSPLSPRRRKKKSRRLHQLGFSRIESNESLDSLELPPTADDESKQAIKKVERHLHLLGFSRIESNGSLLSYFDLTPAANRESSEKKSSTYNMESLVTATKTHVVVSPTSSQPDGSDSVVPLKGKERKIKSLKEFLEKSRGKTFQESKEDAKSINLSTISTSTIRVPRDLPLLLRVGGAEKRFKSVNKSFCSKSTARTEEAVFAQFRFDDGKVEYLTVPLVSPLEAEKGAPGSPEKHTSQAHSRFAFENVGVSARHCPRQMRVSSTTTAA